MWEMPKSKMKGGKKSSKDVLDLDPEEERNEAEMEEKALLVEQRRKTFDHYVFELRHKGLYTLAGEIDRCLKKVSEGMETFEDIWQKVQNASNTSQKEKNEAELKKEIKKLQRLRDQIKFWILSPDIKDKTTLVDTRKLIETQMQRFKVVERETKTKTYSKEGLGAAQKLDPMTKELDELNNWLVATIGQMQIQLDQFECEIESLLAAKKRRLDKDKQDRFDELKTYMERHRFHLAKLETLLRMLDNLSVEINMLRTADGLLQPRKFLSQVKKIKDDLEYYLESNQEPEFEENEFLYDDIEGLKEFDDGLVQQQATGSSAPSAIGEGDLVDTPTSTPGNTSPIHSSDGSSGPEKEGKSPDDSSKVVTVSPVAMLENRKSPNPWIKRMIESLPKVPNDSPSTSEFSNQVSSLSSLYSSPTNTHSYANSENSVNNVNITTCPSEDTIASGINNSNESENTMDEQLQLSSSFSLSPHNQQYEHTTLNSMDPTSPTPSEIPVSNTMSSSTPTTRTMASLAELSASVINSNSDLLNAVMENRLVSPSPPLPQEGSSHSLTFSSCSLASSDHHLHQQQPYHEPLMATSVFEHQQLLAQTLGALATSNLPCFSDNLNPNLSMSSTSFLSPSFGGVVNTCYNQHVMGGPPGFTNASGDLGISTGPISSTLLSTARNSAALLGGDPHISSDNNSSILSQQQQLPQASTSPHGNSWGQDTSQASNMSDYIGLEQEQMLMNDLMYHEDEVEKETMEVHIPPLLSYVPLGQVPLQREQQYQLQILEAAHSHMPVPADSERIRQVLPRNPCPIPDYYPQCPLQHSGTFEFFQKQSLETLFFIFYYSEGMKAQFMAAKALKLQSWRFHTKYMTWFQRHEEPRFINEECEQGTYIYFDIDKWSQRKKDGFVFEYKYLEDKDLN